LKKIEYKANAKKGRPPKDVNNLKEPVIKPKPIEPP
jgi:hypothetical protein